MASPSAARSAAVYSRFDDAALARHYSVACSVVAPSGGECEIVAGHVAAVSGGGHGEGGDLRAQRALGNARYWCFGVE